MNEEKKMTGYPSIDKPWLKYYSEEAINAPLPECTIYEYLLENNKDYPEDPAIKYMNRIITYKELFEGIDKSANAFYGLGIREGDIVTGITPSFPEIIYSFYGLNKIGAVSDWFDPRTAPSIIAEEMKSTKTKAVLIFEDFVDVFAEMLKSFDCPIIVISAINSQPTSLKLPDGWLRYADFIKEYNKEQAPICGKADSPALMEHTGGTTGQPKAVVLTNLNVNSVALFQNKYPDKKFCEKENIRYSIWLAVAFPFTAFALVCMQHFPLVVGQVCDLCFDTDIVKIEKHILEDKPNYMAYTPILWQYLIKSPEFQKADLSFIKNPGIGADNLDANFEREVNDFLCSHNCEANIYKGYGMTELGSAVTACTSKKHNKIGSVGIPFAHTLVSAFDVENGNELKYGEQGEICIYGPSIMKEYYKNPEATANVLKRHSDGRIWVHSGDLGYIDEDGFLFICGRIKRMIVDHHGFKIFAPQVEQALSEISCVEKSCVVGAPDKEHKTGQIAVAYIILRDGFIEDVELLKSECAKSLPDFCVPTKFIFVKEFPYTGAGKVDYRKLEQMTENRA